MVAAALVLSCALAAYPTIDAGGLLPVVAALAVLSVLFAVLALVLRISFVAAALCSLVIEYLVTEASGSVGTASIVVYAVGLVVLCELVFLVSQLPASARVDSSVISAWLRGVALIGIASALLAMVALAATGFRIPGSFTGTIIGSAAAVLLLVFAWLLAKARRSGGYGRPSRASRP